MYLTCHWFGRSCILHTAALLTNLAVGLRKWMLSMWSHTPWTSLNGHLIIQSDLLWTHRGKLVSQYWSHWSDNCGVKYHWHITTLQVNFYLWSFIELRPVSALKEEKLGNVYEVVCWKVSPVVQWIEIPLARQIFSNQDYANCQVHLVLYALQKHNDGLCFVLVLAMYAVPSGPRMCRTQVDNSVY